MRSFLAVLFEMLNERTLEGKGLAGSVIKAVLEEGKKSGVKKALITCAVGNNAAKRLYEKLGFELVGEGHSEECQAALGSSGFYLLCQYY
eukprot:gene26274-32829_t